MIKRILWIDNQLDYEKPHIEVLRENEFEVEGIWNITEGLELLRKPNNKYDLIIMDVLMGGKKLENKDIPNGKTGITAFNIIRNEDKIFTPILFLSVVIEIDILRDLQNKDFSKQRLVHIRQKPLRPSELLREIRQMEKELDNKIS